MAVSVSAASLTPQQSLLYLQRSNQALQYCVSALQVANNDVELLHAMETCEQQLDTLVNDYHDVTLSPAAQLQLLRGFQDVRLQARPLAALFTQVYGKVLARLSNPVLRRQAERIMIKNQRLPAIVIN